ncbi:MAG: zinc ribbon domain-containing protein [Verrucomicrobiota bacterium]|nr:zinc ribbon domain-containing protein [Verrucomicrobiota bacterium]
MPTYEYVCAKCGHHFEKYQPIAAQPLTICPKELCAQKKWGKGKIKRGVGGGAGLIFKGSGFYITDYRSENYKAGAKKDAPTPETKSPSSDAKSTPAPAKTEVKPTPQPKPAAD